jgi:hypothetical protein
MIRGRTQRSQVGPVGFIRASFTVLDLQSCLSVQLIGLDRILYRHDQSLRKWQLSSKACKFMVDEAQAQEIWFLLEIEPHAL